MRCCGAGGITNVGVPAIYRWIDTHMLVIWVSQLATVSDQLELPGVEAKVKAPAILSLRVRACVWVYLFSVCVLCGYLSFVCVCVQCVWSRVVLSLRVGGHLKCQHESVQ